MNLLRNLRFSFRGLRKNLSFTLAVFGCFYAIVTLFQHSPAYLLSAMALVWVADIGAYFSGKAFGKRSFARGGRTHDGE